MKLALHIVRKDFLRLRGWLGLWGLVLVAKVTVGFVARSAGAMSWVSRSGDSLDTFSHWQRLIRCVQILDGFSGVMTFLLALLLVQEDSLVGTRQFWLTRPISGVRLLAAKWLGVVLLLGGVPVLVALPWWLTCGFGWRELAWAITETVGLQLLIALPAVLVASLTDSLQRSLMWTFVLAAAATTAAGWWNFLTSGKPDQDLELMWARTAISLVVLVAAAVVAVTLQFFGRRSGRSIFALGAGIALAAAVVKWWPASWMPTFSPGEANAERAAGVTVAFAGANQETMRVNKSSGMDIGLLARGVPMDSFLASDDTGLYTWRWQNGQTLVREGWLAVSAWQMDEPYAWQWVDAMRATLGLREPVVDAETERTDDELWRKNRERMRAVYESRHEPFNYRTNRLKTPPKFDAVGLAARAMVPRSIIARMQTEPPVFEAKISLHLLRPERWSEVPFRAGAWQNQGGRGIRVQSLNGIGVRGTGRFDDVLRMRLAETVPATWRDDWALIYFPRRDRQSDLRDELNGRPCVLNRSLGQVQYLDSEGTSQIRVCGVRVVWRSARVTVPKVSRDGQWVDWRPRWTEGATLAIIGYREEARFNREVKVERFEPKPAPPVPTIIN